MHIESIRLKNFKAFKDLDMRNIPSFCVLVGANGSGKSTLFKAIGFLKDCMTYNVYQALESHGGFGEVLSRGADEQKIVIELQIRMDIAGHDRLVTYSLMIEQKNARPFVAREILRYKRGESGAPFHFLDFSDGNGRAVRNEEDFSKKDTELEREDQRLENNTILAIKGLGQFERFKAASELRKLIENWHVSDFHIDKARGAKEALGPDDYLSASGDNLQRVAYRLYKDRPDIFLKIVDDIKRSIPGVTDIKPESTKDRRIILTFFDNSFPMNNNEFIDSYVSDGTIKMFAYLILLNEPKAHPVLCIEEPENQLYPTLLEELAEEMEAYTGRGGQVFVSTHSPDFLNAIDLGNVYWLQKRSGYSSVTRAADNEQIKAYMENGDRMGELWKQGFFEGANP
jgi:predicted ATPase